MGQAPPLIVWRCLCLLALVVVAAGAGAQDYAIEGSCRDGTLHGNYELRGGNGQVRVVGAFSRGKRTGSFLFWSSSGTRIAQLPFDDDIFSGTLALWYAPGARQGEARQKLEATYVAGKLHGRKRSWYPDGQLRAEYRYDQGALVEARVFSESGKAFDPAAARAQAATDLAMDDRFYATLDEIIRSHRPPCAPGSDRLERS